MKGVIFRNEGRAGMSVLFPKGEEVVCRKCHRMISLIEVKGYRKLSCVRTAEGIKDGSERIPGFCPLSWMKEEEGEKV